MTETKAQIRERQLQAALQAVAGRPGITAYGVGIHVPVGQPDPSSGVLAVSAPMTLTLSLLAELERRGKVYAVANPKGQQWHPADEPQKGQEALHDDDDPAARRRPQDSP